MYACIDTWSVETCRQIHPHTNARARALTRKHTHTHTHTQTLTQSTLEIVADAVDIHYAGHLGPMAQEGTPWPSVMIKFRHFVATVKFHRLDIGTT